MEARKITVVTSKTQKTSVIMSQATTLGELKADLRKEGIDYNNMSFYEGVSRSELKSDDSYLPQNVPYKGTTTNELVFMLSTVDKKIASGALSTERQELFNKIDSYGLSKAVILKFGKNHTQVKSFELKALIEEHEASLNKNKNTKGIKLVKSTPSTTAKHVTSVEEVTTHAENVDTSVDKQPGCCCKSTKGVECADTKLRDLFSKMLELLKDEDDLYYQKDYADMHDELNDLIEGKTPKETTYKVTSSYTDADIKEMFSFNR